MLIRCEQCGYENFPQHRFCGMCGAKIPDSALAARLVPAQAAPVRGIPSTSPNPQPKNAEPASRPVSGPSFLGLAQQSEEPKSSSASYLLEDDEPAGHRGVYLAILLFVLAIGLGVWHWRQDLSRLSSRSVGAAPATNTDISAAPNTPSSPDASTGASTNPVSDGPSAVAPAGSPAATMAPSLPAQTPPTQPAANVASTGTAPAADSSTQPDPAQAAMPIQPAQPGPPDASGAKPAARKATLQPASTPTQSMEDLEAEGEKYLYGNGVPQNCERARRSLLTAAGRSNGRAQSVLGTMYATGHCAPRDLPLAYRWFAKALHQDPQNGRIEEDLKVLWNQMTPDERNLALRGGV